MTKQELENQVLEAEVELDAIKRIGIFYPISGLSRARSMQKKWDAKILLNMQESINRILKLLKEPPSNIK